MIYTCPRAEVCLYGILGQFCADPRRNRLKLDADCHRKSERQVWEMVWEARLGYLGFEGSIEHEAVWVGRLLGIKDLVTYQSETFEGLDAEFRAAVDDYLEGKR